MMTLVITPLPRKARVPGNSVGHDCKGRHNNELLDELTGSRGLEDYWTTLEVGFEAFKIRHRLDGLILA